ncbi:MAG: signal peptide peptidase SppA [Candidatus Margulisbacteria bacterium]|nr:signal peptide peptidase SppA [Candidatus Margulisiibacteriota bacterium]
MLKKFIYLLILILIFSGAAFADLTDDLFRQGMGIRAMGMGGAATAVGGDASSIFYNPAGLSDLIFEYAVGATDLDQADYTASRYDLLSIGPFAYGNFGLSTSQESASTVMYGFGAKGMGGFNWGVAYKTARWNLLTGNGEGWSADLGILLKITPALSLGVVGQEIAFQRGFLAPSATRVGMALMPLLDRMLFAADVEIDEGRRRENLSHFGMELEITKGLIGRVGSDRGLMTAGATFQFPLIAFEYGMKNRGGSQGLIQRFGGTIRFVKKRERSFSIFGPKEYVEIDLRGAVSGGTDSYSILGGYCRGLDSILSTLRQASRDPGLQGIFIKISDFQSGLGGQAVVQEIRGELEAAKESGKKIVVYIESSALGDGYYLASVGDKIIAPQGASLGGLAKKVEITSIKELYEKLGIEWQLFAEGKNKTTFSGLTEGLTPGQREILKGVVDDLYRQMLTDISEDREIELARLKEIGDGRVLTAKEAQELGLIDEIGYLDTAKKIAAELIDTKEEIQLVKPQNLMPEKDMQDYLFSYFNKVAVIEVDGEITIGGSGDNLLFGGRYIGADTVSENIRKATEDTQVKAIILRVNSPGGSAIASGQIYEEIKRAREKGKIVVTSMGDVGASGGYYIACASNYIVANPGTITGSIGVIGALPIMSGFYEKFGIKKEVVKEGKYADMFSGLRKLTPEEIESIRVLQKDTYDEFLAKVIAGRELPTAEVKAIADGRILTGHQAYELGLVDELGGFQTAINLAKQEAHIRGEPVLVYYGRQPGLFVQVGSTMLQMMGLENGILPEVNKGELTELKLY